MTVKFTARHFKARPELQQFAEDAVRGFTLIHSGIVSADIVLEQQQHGDGRIAEVSLLVARDKLFAKEQSNDFVASLNACVEKLERQLDKYKVKVQDSRHPKEKIEAVDDGTAPGAETELES